MRTHEKMKRDVSLLSPIWGGYWMAHIACPWDVQILSLSRMAERRSQERRQPIVISRRDNDTLRIALTPGNMCVHGPRDSTNVFLACKKSCTSHPEFVQANPDHCHTAPRLQPSFPLVELE